MLKMCVFFGASLLICGVFLRIFPVLNRAMTVIFQRISSRSFPETTSLEHNKFALLRIFFGLIIFIRGINVYDLLLVSERLSPVGLWAGGETLAGVMLIFGLFSQYAFLFLVGAMWQYGDYVVAKSTLGNDVGAMLAIFLFQLNAGKYLAIDAVLLKRFPMLHAVMLLRLNFQVQHLLLLVLPCRPPTII